MGSLHEAAARCQYKQLEMLLKNGEDVNGQDDRGYTPLHCATFKCRIRCFRLLVQAGAKTDIQDSSGMTPVHLVAKKGHRKAMKFFLKNGGDINILSGDSYTPLLLAVEEHRTAMVQLLCQRGADLEAVSGNHLTPLNCAISKESRADIAKILIKHGANIEAKDSRGFTSLHYAAMFDAPNIAQHLLQLGAKMNTKCVHEYIPLQMAVVCNNPRMIGLFLEKGGNVDEMDEDGRTLLHLSICSHRCNLSVMAMVEFLVNQGADLDAKDKNGMTPILMAAFEGQTEIVQYLWELGADPADCRNVWRCDALEMARRGQNPTTIEYLKKLFHISAHGQITNRNVIMAKLNNVTGTL